MLAAALSAVLLSAAPQLELGVSAGAGYDSDVNYADTSVPTIGTGFASLKATGGGSVDLGDSTNLYGGLRFDGEQYPSYSDLSNAAAGAEVSLTQMLGDQLAVVVTPWATQGWAGDPGRNATTLAAQGTLRWKPVRDLTLRGFYSYLDRNAHDDAFSTVKNRVGAGVEWRVVPRTYLSLVGFVEHGREAFYGAPAGVASAGGVATTGGGFGSGRSAMGPGGRMTCGSNQVAYPFPATVSAISPGLELGLDKTFHLLASFEARHVESSVASFDAYSVFAGLGARL